MEKIQITAKLKIQSGKTEEFKKLAKACITIVKEKDTGTLQYDWFYSSDESECNVLETYVNSNAFLEHINNIGDNLGKLLSISDFSVKIYGRASNELKSALNGMDIKYYTFGGGI